MIGGFRIFICYVEDLLRVSGSVLQLFYIFCGFVQWERVDKGWWGGEWCEGVRE